MTKILSKVNSWLKAQEKVRQTRRELSQLNDRELSDIGINRSDIYRISKESINVAI